jgi:taurine dioxygenase
MFFHHDTCFAALPQKALLLHALEVPPIGGNTLFANMYEGYDTLPARLQSRIEGLRALHVFIYTKTERADISRGYEKLLHATHPVAIRHPETGRRALYVNRLMTLRIEGLPEAESDALLAELFDHAERPEFQYEHVWRKGDLVLWDNLATMHARTEMPSREPRVMRHTSLQGVAAPGP